MGFEPIIFSLQVRCIANWCYWPILKFGRCGRIRTYIGYNILSIAVVPVSLIHTPIIKQDTFVSFFLRDFVAVCIYKLVVMTRFERAKDMIFWVSRLFQFPLSTWPLCKFMFLVLWVRVLLFLIFLELPQTLRHSHYFWSLHYSIFFLETWYKVLRVQYVLYLFS